jgi:hypothetical protein
MTLCLGIPSGAPPPGEERASAPTETETSPEPKAPFAGESSDATDLLVF